MSKIHVTLVGSKTKSGKIKKDECSRNRPAKMILIGLRFDHVFTGFDRSFHIFVEQSYFGQNGRVADIQNTYLIIMFTSISSACRSCFFHAF